MRCELVTRKRVRNAIFEIGITNDDRARREIAHENLKDVLRKDLAITK